MLEKSPSGAVHGFGQRTHHSEVNDGEVVASPLTGLDPTPWTVTNGYVRAATIVDANAVLVLEVPDQLIWAI